MTEKEMTKLLEEWREHFEKRIEKLEKVAHVQIVGPTGPC